MPRSAKPLRPSLQRLSPAAALKRILGPQGVFELLRTLLKLAGVGLALWFAVDPPSLAAALHRPAGGMLQVAVSGALRLLAAVLAAFALLAMLDLAWVRWRHLRKLRMSREEVREELKESEGDPLMKSRRRRLQEGRARQRMMAQVPKATVFITNPTHCAIALIYNQGQAAAPRLVARGVDAIAHGFAQWPRSTACPS